MEINKVENRNNAQINRSTDETESYTEYKGVHTVEYTKVPNDMGKRKLNILRCSMQLHITLLSL